MFQRSSILFDKKLFAKKNKPPPINSPNDVGEKGGRQSLAQKNSSQQNFPDTIRNRLTQLRNIYKITDKSYAVLLKIKAVFPFDFFPNELIIDFHKVSVCYNEFFFSSSIQSISYKDIADVTIDTNPFFATLKIINRISVKSSVVIEYLKKNEAIHARKLILGLLVLDREKVDVSSLDDFQIIPEIEQLGETDVIYSNNHKHIPLYL